jgi:hypothetical protein
VLLCAPTTPAHAQYVYLRISATQMPTIQLVQDPTPAQALTISTSWGWLTGDANVNVCVSMTAPMRGTGTNTDTIPQGNVLVNGKSIVSGATNCGIANATLVGTGAVSWLVPGSRTDTPSVQIKGHGSISPDTYTGTITLYALTF